MKKKSLFVTIIGSALVLSTIYGCKKEAANSQSSNDVTGTAGIHSVYDQRPNASARHSIAVAATAPRSAAVTGPHQLPESEVELATLTDVTAIPAPLTVTLEPGMKFVPVMVIGTANP